MDVIKAQSILIIPKQTSDPSVVLSILALGRTLTENGKTVSYYIDETISKSIDIFKDDEKIINDTNSKNELIVKLDNIKSTVTHLDWEQENEELTIKLTSQNGEIGSPDISITHTNQNYDLRIFVQVKKGELETLSGYSDSTIFSGTGVYLYDENNDENIPQTIFNFIKKTKYKISESNAETLLLALRNSTENFTTKITSETFQVAAELFKVSEKSSPEPTKLDMKEKATDTVTNPQKAPLAKPIKVTEKPIQNKEQITKANPKNTEKIEFATPEELPANYDPLSPATTLPEPIKLEPSEVSPQPVANSPLPQAS